MIQRGNTRDRGARGEKETVRNTVYGVLDNSHKIAFK